MTEATGRMETVDDSGIDAMVRDFVLRAGGHDGVARLVPRQLFHAEGKGPGRDDQRQDEKRDAQREILTADFNAVVFHVPCLKK